MVSNPSSLVATQSISKSILTLPPETVDGSPNCEPPRFGDHVSIQYEACVRRLACLQMTLETCVLSLLTVTAAFFIFCRGVCFPNSVHSQRMNGEIIGSTKGGVAFAEATDNEPFSFLIGAHHVIQGKISPLHFSFPFFFVPQFTMPVYI